MKSEKTTALIEELAKAHAEYGDIVLRFPIVRPRPLSCSPSALEIQAYREAGLLFEKNKLLHEKHLEPNRIKTSELHEQIRESLLVDFGFTDKRISDSVWAWAEEQGHATGYEGVVEYLAHAKELWAIFNIQ